MPRQPGWLALKEYGEGVLRSYVVPFGAIFIERCLNTGVFKESDIPYWWAITVLAFLAGNLVGNLLPIHAGGHHSGPSRNRAGHFLLSFVGMVCLLIGVGYVRKLQGLVAVRFFTGVVSTLMWSQEEASWYQSGKDLQASRSGVLISPTLCLGCCIGCLIGGLAFPAGTAVVIKRRPALVPSCVAALAIALPAVFALAMALAKRRPSPRPQRPSPRRPLGRSGNNLVTPPRHPLHLSHSDVQPEMSTGADVESGGGLQQIPANFMKTCGNNRAKAWARYQQTLAWRKANNIDRVLVQPQPHFDVIKKYYPHFIHCRSLRNELIIYEFPGRMDISKLKSSGVGPAQMGQHYAFFMEFLFSHLDPREEARIMTVLDIGGISLSMLSQDVLEVLKITSEIMQSHYPERVVRIVVVNVPFFLGSAWKLIASVLPKSVQDRIELSSDAAKDLRKYIAPENIPLCYKGECRLDFGESPEERELRAVVQVAATHGAAGGATTVPAGPSSTSPRTPAAPPAPIPVTAKARVPQSSSRVPPPTSGRQSTTPSSSSTPSSTSSSQGKGWGFFRGFSSKPKQAFLGYENRYVFDRERQVWVLEDELPLMQQEQLQSQQDEDTRPFPRSPEQVTSSLPAGLPRRREEEVVVADDPVTVEEHGLVLAIQAAHYAERFQRQQQHHATPRHEETSRLLGGAGHYSSSHRHAVEKPPTYLVLKAAMLHMVWSALHLSMEVVAPLWLLTDFELGGVGLNPRAAGVLMAIVSIVIMGFSLLGPKRVREMPWVSPLRAFRLSAGLLVVLTVSAGLCHPILTLGLRAPFVGMYYALLLSLLAIALAIGRRSSATLLYMALKRRSSHPSMVVRATGLAGELPSPLMAAVLVSWSLQADVAYPLDSRLFLNVCGLASMGLYVFSLLLHVNVTGDFGVSGEGFSDDIQLGPGGAKSNMLGNGLFPTNSGTRSNQRQE